MKIGMVAWSFYPRVGGSVSTAIRLSEALVRRGIEVEIIAPLCKCDEDRIGGLAVDPRIKIHWVVSPAAKDYAGLLPRFIFFCKMASRIRSLSRSVDVFHSHDFNIGVLSALFGSGKPVIAVFGADPLFEAFNYNRREAAPYGKFLKNKAVILMQKAAKAFLSLLGGKRLVVISLDPALKEIIKRYHAGRVFDIPAGIDTGLYKKGTGVNSGKGPVLVVSRMMPWKGIDTAVKSFEMLKEGRPDARMVIVGDGPLRKDILKKYGKTAGLSFVTDADYRKTAGYYKDASVFLSPSKYETFGINIVEAMAAGLPVVARDLEVYRGRISDGVNGYLVGEDDPRAFCGKLSALLGDSATRERMSEAAVKKACEYDVGIISERYIKLYHGLTC